MTTVTVPPESPVSTVRRLAAFLVLAAGAAGLLVIVLFDPAAHGLYPRCLFFTATGWQCPGCGSLRAIHALGHGHLLEAARLNIALIFALPVLGHFVAEELRFVTGKRPHTPSLGLRKHGWILPAAFVAYWVLRNLG